MSFDRWCQLNGCGNDFVDARVEMVDVLSGLRRREVVDSLAGADDDVEGSPSEQRGSSHGGVGSVRGVGVEAISWGPARPVGYGLGSQGDQGIAPSRMSRLGIHRKMGAPGADRGRMTP